MSTVGSPGLETFLARLYDARARLLADPSGETERAGLPEAERRALIAIDREGLQLAAEGFARKRNGHRTRPRQWDRFPVVRLVRRWFEGPPRFGFGELSYAISTQGSTKPSDPPAPAWP